MMPPAFLMCGVRFRVVRQELGTYGIGADFEEMGAAEGRLVQLVPGQLNELHGIGRSIEGAGFWRGRAFPRRSGKIVRAALWDNPIRPVAHQLSTTRRVDRDLITSSSGGKRNASLLPRQYARETTRLAVKVSLSVSTSSLRT